MRRLSVMLLCGTLLGMLGAWLSAGSPTTHAAPPPLFGTPNLALTRQAAPLPEQIGTRRTRLMSLSATSLSYGLRSGSLVLNLFDDVVLTTALRAQPLPAGNVGMNRVWAGEIDGMPRSSVILVSDGADVFDLRVLTGSTVYYAQTTPDGLIRISEIEAGRGRYDADGYPIDDAIPFTPTTDEMQSVRAIGPRADDGTIIDLLVAYTPAAQAMLGGELPTRAAIQGAVALTNQTYLNSGVAFRIRIVAIVPTVYVETPSGGPYSSSTDLVRLYSSGDGYMDELHTLRNTHKADLVALIAGTPVNRRNYCGIAQLPTVIPAPAQAFSITEAHCINDITLAHELGHNMGKTHDRSNASGAVHPYAYGYQDPATHIGDTSDFVTVMAYSTNPSGTPCPRTYTPGICPAIAWWSDPTRTFNSKVLGVINSEDNARSLNETALVIANYRVSDDGGAGVPTAIPTPTALPLPTAVPPTASERVLNGGFELDADRNAIPDGWMVRGGTRWCSTTTAPNRALSGQCSLRLTRSGTARQTLTHSSLSAGQTLIVRFEAKGQRVPTGAYLVLRVNYVSPTAGIWGNGYDIARYDLPNGGFTLPADDYLTLTLADTPTQLFIRVRYPNGVGSLRLDSLSVKTP